VSFEENKIKDYVLLSKATFIIDDSGKIVAQNVPKNFSDSNMVASK
jgi:peroxiredoxin